jgi:hypothetical protein
MMTKSGQFRVTPFCAGCRKALSRTRSRPSGNRRPEPERGGRWVPPLPPGRERQENPQLVDSAEESSVPLVRLAGTPSGPPVGTPVAVFPAYVPTSHVQAHTPWSWRADPSLRDEGHTDRYLDGDVPPIGYVAYRMSDTGRLVVWKSAPAGA